MNSTATGHTTTCTLNRLFKTTVYNVLGQASDLNESREGTEILYETVGGKRNTVQVYTFIKYTFCTNVRHIVAKKIKDL